MFFSVLSVGTRPPGRTEEAFLIVDHWDDWFSYETMFSLIVFDKQGHRHDIGIAITDEQCHH